MKSTRRGWRKYLVLLPLVYLIVGVYFYRDTTEKIDNALLLQKYDEVVHAVDMISTSIDALTAKDADWGLYDYDPYVNSATQYVDELFQVFGAAYRVRDGEFKLISLRSAEQEEFDPLKYQEFLDAADDDESGGMRLQFKPESLPEREMWLYFRCMPTPPGLANRYLAAAAVSMDSITVPMASTVAASQMINIAVVLGLTIWYVAIISHAKPARVILQRKREGGTHV